MPYRKDQFITGDIYHINSKAIDKNLLFKDVNDYFRGVYSIYEFNNSNPVNIFNRRRDRVVEKKIEKLCEGGAHTNLQLDQRDRFVDVSAFCFMPNHIHLLLKQIKDNGIIKFMSKVGGGYGRYFNTKYERKGYVFQDRFQSVHIENNNQFMATTSYLFTNPIALIEPGWKELGIRSHATEEVEKFLEEYKWSSYQDCIGIKNFPSVTERDFLLEMIGGSDGLKNVVKDWIEHKKDIAKYSDLFLE